MDLLNLLEEILLELPDIPRTQRIREELRDQILGRRLNRDITLSGNHVTIREQLARLRGKKAKHSTDFNVEARLIKEDEAISEEQRLLREPLREGNPRLVLTEYICSACRGSGVDSEWGDRPCCVCEGNGLSAKTNDHLERWQTVELNYSMAEQKIEQLKNKINCWNDAVSEVCSEMNELLDLEGE